MPYLVDTNVLLRFVDQRDPSHTMMRTAIRKLHHEGHQLCIAPQNCVEFWNVATRPVARNGFGFNTAKTERLLRLIERIFIVLDDQPGVYAEWRHLVVQYGVNGVQVHDARLVAMMQIHALTHILTRNTSDFTRYANAGITAIDPADV